MSRPLDLRRAIAVSQVLRGSLFTWPRGSLFMLPLPGDSVTGPSPRVRGSLQKPLQIRRRAGSIPACAGKPAGRPRYHRDSQVHPRVCGEALIVPDDPDLLPGPSPRVRGSRSCAGSARAATRSIPACAGKPRAAAGVGPLPRVHPRVCGEAIRRADMTRGRLGPSPRVRGSPHCWRSRRHVIGSIPACAGKPNLPIAGASLSRVHPRVCGEAVRVRVDDPVVPGPSPRVRGSLRLDADARMADGSIPACAGKPGAHVSAPPAARVHPRVCGEAPAGSARWTLWEGPSPRVRGSLLVPVPGDHPPRSIPACAGKPRPAIRPSRSRRVHPRVCGEATALSVACLLASGPSPRVRGSHAVHHRHLARDGSIPACAGKPGCARR